MSRTIYISPRGSDEAEGTEARPKRTAQAAIEAAGWGCEVVVQSGFYGPDAGEALWVVGDQKGEARERHADTRTVVRAERPWQAGAAGVPSHALLARDAPPISFEGFQVLGCAGDGAKALRSPGLELHGLWVRAPGNQGAHISSESDGARISRCLFEGGQTNPRWNHGIYGRSEYEIDNSCVRNFGGYGIGGTEVFTAEGVVLDGNGSTQVYALDGCSIMGSTLIANNNPAITLAGGHAELGGLLVVQDFPVRHALQEVRPHATGLIAQQRLREALHDRFLQVRNGTATIGTALVCDSRYQARLSPAYWLEGASPARGVADPSEVPEVDWFGRCRADRDLGAHPFDPRLTRESAETLFWGGEPYLRGDKVPDLWRLPEAP